jgi:hypothetical protein
MEIEGLKNGGGLKAESVKRGSVKRWKGGKVEW